MRTRTRPCVRLCQDNVMTESHLFWIIVVHFRTTSRGTVKCHAAHPTTSLPLLFSISAGYVGYSTSWRDTAMCMYIIARHLSGWINGTVTKHSSSVPCKLYEYSRSPVPATYHQPPLCSVPDWTKARGWKLGRGYSCVWRRGALFDSLIQDHPDRCALVAFSEAESKLARSGWFVWAPHTDFSLPVQWKIVGYLQ